MRVLTRPGGGLASAGGHKEGSRSDGSVLQGDPSMAGGSSTKTGGGFTSAGGDRSEPNGHSLHGNICEPIHNAGYMSDAECGDSAG